MSTKNTSVKKRQEVQQKTAKDYLKLCFLAVSVLLGLAIIFSVFMNSYLLNFDPVHPGTSLSALISTICILIFAVAIMFFSVFLLKKSNFSKIFAALALFSVMMSSALYVAQCIAGSFMVSSIASSLSAENAVALYESANQKVVLATVFAVLFTSVAITIYNLVCRYFKQKSDK